MSPGGLERVCVSVSRNAVPVGGPLWVECGSSTSEPTPLLLAHWRWLSAAGPKLRGIGKPALLVNRGSGLRHLAPANESRRSGDGKPSSGPIGTMRVGLADAWL